MAVARGTAHAPAGLLDGRKDLDPITLASGKPLTKGPYELTAGKYYRIAVESDGSAELAVSGADFFRNVWINEIVINEIEIRPLGVDSIEFDDEGKAQISFVPIRPGTFILRVPGTTSECAAGGLHRQIVPGRPTGRRG